MDSTQGKLECSCQSKDKTRPVRPHSCMCMCMCGKSECEWWLMEEKDGEERKVNEVQESGLFLRIE